MTGAALFLVAVLAGPFPADTSVSARQGDVVVVGGIEGSLVVEAWRGGSVSVEREGRDDAGVTVTRSGNRIEVRSDGRRGRRPMDLVLRLPAGVGLEVEGLSLDVEARGLSGAVTVRNVNGDVELEDIRGDLDVFTVEGGVRVENVRGDVRVEAQSDEVSLEEVQGDVWVTSGSGEIDLLGIEADRVFAETMSGDVTFRGALRDGGTYELSSHSGDLDVNLPDGTNAAVRVATFDGEFESEFPVVLQGFSTGGTFDFTLGEGGATLSIRAFDGEIWLRRLSR